MSSEDKFFRILKETKDPAIDVETSGLRWTKDYVCGYSVSDGTDAVYIPVRHAGGGNISQPDYFECELGKSVSELDTKLIGHNIKFDMHFSENQGIKFKNVEDTMVNEALLDENRRSYSLENVANSYKDKGVTPKLGKLLYEHIGREFGVKPDRSSMAHYHRLRGDDPLAVEYGAGDTLTTKQLREVQKKQLYKEELDMVHEVENNLTYVLQKMERRGVQINPTECQKVKKQVEEMYWEAYSKIPVNENEDGSVVPLNVRSAKDLKEYFEWCEITDWPMTLPTERFPRGQPSFKKEYLATSQEGLNILNVRKLAHLKSSFLDVLDNHIYNHKIHTTFNQTRGETHGTRSGRLSCSFPNMQQVPKRDQQLGSIYRRMFVPNNDYIFIEYDYSQAEPRLYTHYSGEPTLLKGYTSEPIIDMHMVAAQYMHVTRAVAKSLNLGMMYTMGPKKLAIQLGISQDEAFAIYKLWHKTFPYVSRFTKKAEEVAADRGYVKTLLGRRSRFDNINFCYRAANRIVQGGSADILKYKMVEIDRYLVANGLEEVCQMILTIHDSIAFMIHKDYMHLVKVLQDMLERVQIPPFNLKVPFTVDYKMGANWAEASYGKDDPQKLAA